MKTNICHIHNITCKGLIFSLFLSFFITFSATLVSGCGRNKCDSSALLSTACNSMLEYILSRDAITCNYNVMNPAKYINGSVPKTLGSYFSDNSSNNAFFENELSIMNSIDYNDLSDEEKLTFDALYESLTLSVQFNKYPYYDEPLSPVSGIQVELPVLLAEYHLYNSSYIETYFEVIKSVPSYISDILEYEKIKIQNKTFMSGEQADEIITQCTDFISNSESNYLIDTFESRLAALSDLTADEISRYSVINRELIQKCIIPAYRNIIDFLSMHKDNAISPTGLCGYGETGKDYYELLFRQMTNCAHTPAKSYSILTDTLANCKNNIAGIASNSDNPDILADLSLPVSSYASAKDIVATLKQSIKSTYPELPKDNALQLKSVHPSLENSLSPAMYLTPPIDADTTDCIYINNASCEPEDLYTTLAHEAFPGHLYQTRYFMGCSPHPIRLLLNFPGWIEGWATYAELDSLSLIGTDVAKILRENKLAMLCIYSIIDIGVHYMDWSLMDTIRFLKENGINDTSVSKQIYMSVISEPVLYPKYTLGCIEFIKLREYTVKKEGDRFNPIAFHKQILETGPIWFDVLWDNFNQ